MRRAVWSVAIVLQPEKILRGDVLSQIDDGAERKFRATEEDGKVSEREEDIAEPLDARKGSAAERRTSTNRTDSPTSGKGA